MKKQKSNLAFKKAVTIFFVIFAIIIVFALFDYFVHLLSEEYAVPARYFTNKLIYGTLIGVAVYFFVRKFKLLARVLIFSAVVSVLLQTRYFLEGYSLKFVLLFLGIHFFILLIVSWLAFKFVKI